MAKPIDRRKKYTRMVLKDSLLELLKQKPMSSITVKEICEWADVNRSTFYAHYENQLDLLEKIEEDMIEDMKGYMNQFQYEEAENALRVLKNLFEYFASNRKTCLTLLDKNTESSFQTKVTEVAHEYFMRDLPLAMHVDERYKAYLSTFIINGSIHVVKNWLERDMDKPPQQMAGILNNLINKGLKGMDH